MQELRAIGVYNQFLEQNEQYYTNPQSLARVAILSDTTDTVVPYLDQLSGHNLNYDVLFNYQVPHEENLKQYKVIVLPNTNPLSEQWCQILAKWVREDGGTLIAVQDASLFLSGPTSAKQDFGLGTLLGISKREIPTTMETHSRGAGSVVYLPNSIQPQGMMSLVRRFLKQSELVHVEAPDATLSNVAYQPAYKRVVLHLLNYRQQRRRGFTSRWERPLRRSKSCHRTILARRKQKFRCAAVAPKSLSQNSRPMIW